MYIQQINRLVSLCHAKGVQHAIISPGSRSAPLTLSFVRHPEIQTKLIPDERTAGFVALGLALATRSPVVLVCTSGSALLNYAPAIAEAYYREVPLIVLSADRPPEWIDQLDGQTIQQHDTYHNHIKASYTLPVDLEHQDAQWHANRQVNEVINISMASPQGPAHLNIPIREPFYPSPELAFEYPPCRVIKHFEDRGALKDDAWNELASIWNESDNILIAVGQHLFDPTDALPFSNQLERLSEVYMIPLLGDAISNLSTLPLAENHEDLSIVRYHDLILGALEDDDDTLSPDLLITFGHSFISKPLKQYLRKHPPKYHWHIHKGGIAPDTFQALTHHLSMPPYDFFTWLLSKLEFGKKGHHYHQLWYTLNMEMEEKVNNYWDRNDQAFSELEAVQMILEHLPEESACHLSNSMPVRYANYLSSDPEKQISFLGNRGTSGIDGCTSTAMGYALGHDGVVTLLTGDMAFFYDRNAFWMQDLPSNLRIILLNNQGGNIFRMIKGPRQQAELEDYFVTKQNYTAQSLASEYQLSYACVTQREALQQALLTFFEGGGPKILEVQTDSIINEQVFAHFKKVLSS